MDPLLMVKTAVVLLAVAALGGLLMAGIRFSGAERPPSSIAMLHGLLAGAALTLLLYAWATAGIPQMARWGTMLLCAVAAVGVWLNLQYHSHLRAIPKAPIVVHGLVAVAAFVMLVMSMMGAPDGERDSGGKSIHPGGSQDTPGAIPPSLLPDPTPSPSPDHPRPPSPQSGG